MCNGIIWIVLAWLFLGNNGSTACGGDASGCGQTTNTLGCGCRRETYCGQAIDAQNDGCGCDRVRVVRDCGC